MDIDSDEDYRESSSGNESTQPPIHNKHGVSPIQGSIPIHRKRRVENSIAAVGPPPLKRMKGDFNAAYLELLNRDINDASSGLIHGEEEEDADTQIGAVVWSAAERAALFTAVSRLGRGDCAGISARIGTKSAPEVRQYLVLLDATEGKGKGKGVRQNALRPVDVPAAVEIGAECGAALEAAADALSLRQESYEEQVEKERWGSRWCVTAPLAETLENQQRMNSEALAPRPQPRARGRKKEQRRDEEEDREEQQQLEDEEQEKRGRRLDELPFFELFCIQNWLLLSDRIFMNSAVSDNNWRAASEEHEPPAIQMTALADFYGLAVSTTRRLLLTAMYVAESRIRRNSFEVVQRRRKLRIRVDDVIAAVSSLGMKHNPGEFWAQCARRLQLDVVYDRTGEDDLTAEEYEDSQTHRGEEMDRDDRLPSTVESEPGGTEGPGQNTEENEVDDSEIMSYDEVEAALGYPVVDNMHSRHSIPESGASTAADISSSSEDETDEGEQYQEEYPDEEGDDDDEYERDVKMEDQQETPDDVLNPAAVTLDVEEAMISLASIEYAADTDAVKVIRSRIRAEHRLERDAELLDSQASAEAERKLWAVLRGDSDTRTIDGKR
ncbi:hypothetical protein F5B21DRAFT_402805 [Xylaria acuta]|nr:hypothetical protein F5B21DRAFT_402805 [Xylaria acuta]